ncbi:HTH-type transcriptional regulator DmlR [Vibrio stylophorae]|uniref:HTH-type transcriptional regulator DmlR n=1 Tax=Vibrio stylophorae TaxID=659351 RepID=A0ABN8DWF6_9VIBR|nr:LysR family transcriptional regulator [Vibrio stylophorae]CAH0535638.1 HTH-type transcriptional regulator DmlR [Vibrio stylophorae]
MIDQISLTDIRAFVRVAELGNFTKAAEVLAVSRSHISRQMQSLEQQLGVSLMVRTTRTMRLTPAGEQLFDACKLALKQLEQGVLAAVDDSSQMSGQIRVNCVGGPIGEGIITDAISAFLIQHPKVQIELDFSSPRIDLIADQFDIAFRMGDLDDAGFIAKPLSMIEMVTLASPHYLAQYGAPQSPKDLRQHRCLTGSVTRWRFQHKQDASQSQELVVSGPFYCKNGRSIVASAKAGLGIIRVPSIYCPELIESGELVPVMPDWLIPAVPFSAIFHRQRYQPKRLRALIDFVAKFVHDRHANLMS